MQISPVENFQTKNFLISQNHLAVLDRHSMKSIAWILFLHETVAMLDYFAMLNRDQYRRLGKFKQNTKFHLIFNYSYLRYSPKTKPNIQKFIIIKIENWSFENDSTTGTFCLQSPWVALALKLMKAIN